MTLFHAASASCKPWKSSISSGAMGKASKWLRNLFTRKKELASVAVVAEKKRWSFHRRTAPAKQSNPENPINAAEDAAAVKIQTTFRSYLARKALRALKGLVILQAMVRGHLVRKRATAALHSMQALLSAQARARARRIRALDEQRQHDERRSSASHDTEESVRIARTDLGDEASISSAQEHKDLSSSCRLSSSSGKHETPSSSSFISYMAATESSRAKARSWRPDEVEWRRRSSAEGGRSRRTMFDSTTPGTYLRSWSVKLDRSNASSTGSVNTKCCN